MKLSSCLLVGFAVFLLAVPASPQQVQEATVKVTEKGYEPAELKFRPGIPVRLTFMRETDRTCGTEVIMPEYDIERELPLNERVVIEFTPQDSGNFAFACAMNMVKGRLVISEN